MILERLSKLSPSWLLDERYEIILSSNNGTYLTIRDKETNEEHEYFNGGGKSTQEYGLHNFPIKQLNNK